MAQHKVFFDACAEGNADAVRAAMVKTPCTHQIYNMGLVTASFCGHMHIIHMMIEQGANDWDNALANAANMGRTEIMDFLIIKGASDYQRAFVDACEGGQIETMKMLLKRCSPNEITYHSALENVIRVGRTNIFKFLINHMQSNNIFINWFGIKLAVSHYNRHEINYELLKYLLAANKIIDWNAELKAAMINKNAETIKLAIANGGKI